MMVRTACHAQICIGYSEHERCISRKHSPSTCTSCIIHKLLAGSMCRVQRPCYNTRALEQGYIHMYMLHVHASGQAPPYWISEGVSFLDVRYLHVHVKYNNSPTSHHVVIIILSE